MATRVPHISHLLPDPPTPPLQTATISGHVGNLNDLPTAVYTDQIDVDYILNKGRILYYYRLASSKFTKTKYGLCFLLKDNLGTFQMVTFIKPKKVKKISFHNYDYFFYSDVSLIETSQRDHYLSAIQEISEEAMEYLLPHLLIKDWENHSNQAPFISIAAFLHHIISTSAHVFMIKRLSSNLDIDWGFVDNKGNSFIHAACELKRNIDLTKVIIDNAMNKNHLLINVSNFENQTPLRLCIERINQQRGDYSNTFVLVEYLIKKGATLIIHKNESESVVVTNQFFIDCFQAAKEEKSELIIAYEFPKKGSIRNTYIYSKLNDLNHCQIVRTIKLQKRPDLLANLLKEQFDLVLQTNCPEIIEYIFRSRNALLSKVNIATDNGDTMVHLAVRYANPTILRYFLKEYEDWGITNAFGDNVLHTSIGYRNFTNLKVLVDIIPKQDLNQLLFTPNKFKIIISNSIMEKCEAFESLVIAITKGCLNEQGNNFLHIAVENLNLECLKFLVLNTPVLFFSSKNNIRCTPLQLAVIHQFIPAVELLLENSSISLDSEDNFGFNLFHNSIKHYNEVIFKMVLSAVKKFDAKHRMNNLINTCTHPNLFPVSLTPCLLSIQLKKLDVTELLISHGAKIDRKDVEPHSLLNFSKEFESLKRLFTLKLDGRNMTGLIHLTNIQDLDFNRNHLLEHFYLNGEFNDFQKCFRDLSLSNICKQNAKLNTILHLAIENPFSEKLNFLLDQISALVQSDERALQFVDAINWRGETALYLAVKKSYHVLAKRIVDIGASIETVYANENNILHVSIFLGDQTLINILLALPEITKLFCETNKEGKTPVQMLIHNGFINQALTAIEKLSQNVENRNLKINGCHMLEYFYLNGEPEQFHRCFQALPVTKIIEQNTELNTILHLAIENPFEEKLSFLLDQISDLAQSDERALQLIDAINGKGETALYLAVKSSNHALAKRILDIGASIETVYANEDNILHVSIFLGDQTLINILLALPEITKLFCNMNKEGEIPVQMLINYGFMNQALSAIEKVSGNVEIQNLKINERHILEYFYLNGEPEQFRRCFQALPITKIIEQRAKLNTILHHAIENPFEEKLNFLLDQISALVQSDERALQFVDAINGKGETALYLAVKKSYHALTKRILDIGASIETVYANENNILHVSIFLGDQTMMNILLALPEIAKLFCETNRNGETPVQMLIHNGYINQTLTVIEKVSQNVEIQNLKINGRHMLEYLYLHGEPEQFQRCFQALPVTKIIEPNTELDTILHLAIENPFEDKLNFLLNQIADAQSDERALQLINVINGKGETALYLAVKKSYHALTTLILDIGASIGILYANEDNILHVAIDFSDQVMINIFLARPEITKLFCRPNKDGITPINLLIHNDYIVEALAAIERIRPGNLLGDDGEFLLMLAIELDNQIVQNAIFNRLPIESLLLVDNIQINILYYAIAHQNIFSIKILIQHNIDITVKNSSGKTALHLAIDLRDDQIWSLLFEYLITFNEHTQHEIVDIPNLKDPNLFQYSIMENYFPAVRDLFKLRPNIFITHHANEDTIIHLATKLLDCVPILDHLLNQINREDVEALLQLTNSLDLPPLHYAVHCGNTEALKLFQRFNMKIAVPSEGNFFFFNKLFSDKLVLCKHLQTPPNSTRKTFLYGYKVNSPKETQFILTDIPHLKHCKLYQQAEVEVVHRVNEEDLSILLQVPSTDFFQILISKQIINLKNSFSNESTLLHQAARHSNCSVVNYFLKYKGSDKQLARHMDLFALDSIGNSVLYYAIQNSNEDNRNEFLSSVLINISERLRANPKFPNILNKENANSKRILEVCFDLNKFDAFKCMLDPTFQMELTYEDSDGYTLLHKIVKRRRDVRFLIALLDEIKRRTVHESFAKYLNHPTRGLQQTAFHLCILKNQMTLLNQISKYSPNFSCKDKDGNTPLHLASKFKSNNKYSNTNTLVQLLNGYILNLEGDTISLLNAVNNQHITPIHFAIMNGNIHISNLLLSKGANLYVVDNDRKSVLHYAIENENKAEIEKVIKFLLDYEQTHLNPGNDLLRMHDKKGNTPLHLAILQREEFFNHILTAIVENMKISPDNYHYLTIVNNKGLPPLHFAIDSRNNKIWSLLFEYLTTFNERTQHKIVDILNLNYLNLFQYSITQNFFPAVKDLLKLRPNIFITHHVNEDTIIHLATKLLDCVPILKHLLNQINREDVEALLQLTNSLDLPPLHYAVHCGNTEALKLFQRFNLKIAVPSEGNFFFFNKLFSDKLVLCKHLQTPPNSERKTFLYGYKVNSPKETLFILTDVPHLKHCKLYQQAEVEVVHRVNEEDLSILLQVPSTDFFQILISKQIINLKNSFSNESTLLHQAARHSNCSVVNYFLKYKGSDKQLARHMDLFALDSIGNSVLYYAIQNSNEDNRNEFLSSVLINILERLRTNPQFSNILNKENANSKRILEVCFDLNKFDAFKCMLDPTFQMELTYEDSDGCTLLHKIVKGRGDERFVIALLDEIKRRTVHESFAEYLDHPTRDLQQTSLHLCILKNQTTLLILITKYSPNFSCKDKDGNTPLHLATKLKSDNEHSATNAFIQSFIGYILNLEGDTISLLNAVNNQRLTPIHFAIMNGNIHISNLLLSKGANLYVVDNDRKSVLHYAIENENKAEIEKVIKFLLDYEQTHLNPGNDLLRMHDKKGNTPLHLAILQREEFFNHILTAIVENMKISPDNYHYLTIVNNKGLPPLHFAIDSRNNKIWSLLFEYLTTFNERTQHKIVDILNLNYLNLFQYSITQNFFPAVKDLLKLRPNIFITHHVNEDTIIHLATKLLDCVPILKHLLNQINREDVEALLQLTNSLDLPPLHYAVHCGNTEALKLFQRFNLKIAVPSEGNFFFFNKLFSDKLVLCKHLQTPPNSERKTFLYGYKVNSPKETLFILTDVPHLKHCKLYQQAEVEVVHRVNEEDLSILLQVPSTDFFQILISKQIINLKNSFSNESTLLHQAARHSNCSVVNYFLKYKGSDKQLARHMDLFALDSIGNSVLYYAIQNSNEDNRNEFLSSVLINILERLRTNPQFSNILNKENANSKRILEVCFDLNKFDAFKCMLDPTFQMELTYEDSDGYTLLHKIVKGRGDERFVIALLDEIKRRTVHESFAEYLDHPTRDLQQTSLHLCILKNQTTLLILITKYSPNFSCKDKDGNTPLHLATKLKSDNEHSATNAFIQSFIGYILNLEGDTISLLNAVNNQHITPIHFAIMNGNIHISNLLLSKGANLYAVDNDRKSVLHYAIENENKAEIEKVIKFLLDYEHTHPNPGNDLLHMQDKQGNTPLHSAVTLSKFNLIKILLNRNPNLSIANNNKKTILHISFYDNCQKIVTLILEYICTTRGHNQVMNMQDDQGNSPLHIAIKYESCYSLKKLLSANATLDLKDNSGQTPLHLAILKGGEVFNHILTAIKEKIQLSPDNYHYLTIVNNEGLSPLHHALMNATNISYIEKLINIGAKLSYTDKMGSITMCAGKGGLDLCLLKQVKYGSRFQLLNNFSEGWIGVNWFVGFKVKHFPLWVVTKLLELDEIEIMEEQNVTEVTQFRFEDEILVNLIKCESIDPIRVAIEKNLFPHETNENGKKLLSFVQDRDGSAPVKKYVKKYFRPVEEICFWILSVFDLKEMNLIFESLHNLNLTLIKPDSSKLRGEELKRNEISIALSNALLYSLDNESIEYFNFLLSHNLCLNAQYGVEKDGLLHAMIKKKKSNEFLALFLNTVCEYETKSKEKILIKGEPLIDARNAESLTPLALCVINRQERMLNFLLTHEPSLTVLSDSGNSILHYVATAGDEAIAEILFSKILNSPPDNIRNLFNMPNSDGCIPLHLAVGKGNVRLSEMFLNNGSTFYSQDFVKRTILHHAIENPDQTLHSAMIEFILAYEVYEQHKDPVFGKKIVEIGGTETSIPLNYAINKKSLNAVKLLAPYPSTLRHRDQNNQSVLHLVCGITDNDIVDEILNQISLHQDKYRDVFDCIACYEDEKGLTALQICIMLRNKHALRNLLTQKLCLNLPNCQWNLKLKQAIRNEADPEFKKLLVEMQSNSGQIAEFHLYSENAKNLPPLHSAIEKGNISGVQILLKQGAKLAHKQKCGTITFWDQITNLKLCILLELRDKSIIYAGYKLNFHTKWVVSKLPQISKTEIKNSNEILLLDSVDSLNALHLSIIFRCHSIEPFTAICNFLCSDDMIEEDTLIEFAGKFSTAEVMTFFINYFKIEVFRRNKISLLESAIKHNPDVDTISLILKHLPRIENLELPGIQAVKYNRDQLIALCLYYSFEISLNREDTAVFNILLRFGVKLDNPYGKDAGTILHLMATKSASKFVIPLLDWLRKSNKTITFNNVRFIDAQNNLGETALHLFVKAELIPQIKLILNYRS